jgi:hypothetical protein
MSESILLVVCGIQTISWLGGCGGGVNPEIGVGAHTGGVAGTGGGAVGGLA